MMRSIAILGGAFDPVTKGHTQIAELALGMQYDLNEVWIMPCYRHVFDKRMTGAKHRLAMCGLACSHRPNTIVSDYEIRTKAARGTYHLLSSLLDEPEIKGRTRVSMIIGQDNANTIGSWIEWEKLVSIVRFIVVPRQGVAESPGRHWYDRPPHIRIRDERAVMDVSSTLARTLIRDGEFAEAKRYVDDAVLEYIADHGLYRT